MKLSLARLDQERPRPPARPYVGDRRRRRTRRRSRRPRALPQLAAPVRPRPADDGIQALMGARDVARATTRSGAAGRLRSAAPFLAIETADTEGLASFDGEGVPASLLISGNRAATLKPPTSAAARRAGAGQAQPVDRPRRRDRDRRSGARPRDLLKGLFQTAPLVCRPRSRRAPRPARRLARAFTRRDGPAVRAGERR